MNKNIIIYIFFFLFFLTYSCAKPNVKNYKNSIHNDTDKKIDSILINKVSIPTH